jgi:hypothetical protein
MATILNRTQTFATNGTVTAAGLHNLIDDTAIYAGLITTQTNLATVSTGDKLLIAQASGTDTSSPWSTTVQNLFDDALTNGTYTDGHISDNLTYGTATGNRTVSTSATITNGTITTLNSTTGTIATLNSTAGTIATLNSTTGTIATFNSTTPTFLGAITASTAVINVGSGQIYKDASGNVGIGVTNPSGKLEILQNSTSNTTPAIKITGSSGDPTNYYMEVVPNLSGSLVNYRFNVKNISTYSDVLCLNGTGNVGVGTASPATKLHIASGNIRLDDNQYILWGGNANGINGNNASNLLSFYTSSTERLRIDSSGNVGIGVTSSSALLHVENATGEVARFVGVSTANTRTAIGNGTGYGYIESKQNNNNAVLPMSLNPSGGNVGIGVTAPVNKLEVVGSFGRGAPVTKTADFTLAATENWIIVNKAAATCNVTLPAASSWTGREFTIKTLQAFTVVSASSNVVPRNGTAAGTAILAAVAGNWATLVSDGTNWIIMCGS